MNAFAERMTPNVTTLIRLDHSYILAVFHRYRADVVPTKKRALVTNASLLLEVHTQLEEEIFYPALRQVLSEHELLDKSEAEHAQMRGLIGDLRAMTSGNGPANDDACDEKFFELMRLVMHHVADEETQLLPAAERLMRDQLARLGIDMTKRRLELLKPHAAQLAETTVRSFPAGAAAGAAIVTAGALAGAMLLARNARRSAENRMGRWRH